VGALPLRAAREAPAVRRRPRLRLSEWRNTSSSRFFYFKKKKKTPNLNQRRLLSASLNPLGLPRAP